MLSTGYANSQPERSWYRRQNFGTRPAWSIRGSRSSCEPLPDFIRLHPGHLLMRALSEDEIGRSERGEASQLNDEIGGSVSVDIPLELAKVVP
jgi:hypothetical protein